MSKLNMDIIFTGNFIRFKQPHQPAKMLFDLLRLPINRINNTQVKFCFPICSDENISENWSLYQGEGASLPKELINTINVVNELIIGFEIPPSICSIFSEKGTPYINFFIHPIRFLPDLLFQVSTNNAAISEMLKHWSISLDENTNIYSDRIRRYCVKENLKQNFIKPGTVAIFGQTANDASVVSNGKFLSLNDFEDEIRQYTKDAIDIILVPHPYEKNVSHLIHLIDKLGKGRIVNLNSYSLLCNDNIDTIITLSSSIGSEARFFQKNVKYLLGESLAIGSSMIPSDALVHSLGQVVFETAFWKDVLQKKTGHNSDLAKRHFQEENLLRHVFGGWAYNEIAPNMSFHSNKSWNIINVNETFTNQDLKVINLKDTNNIDFSAKGNSFLYTFNGFSYSEEWGTWTDGDEAELKLPSIQCSNKGWIINLYGYINEKVNEQRFSIFIDDEFVGSVTINSLACYIVRIPLKYSIKSKRYTSIKFQILNAVSPFNLGLCQDKRNLGLRFINAHISNENINNFEVVTANETGHSENDFRQILKIEKKMVELEKNVKEALIYNNELTNKYDELIIKYDELIKYNTMVSSFIWKIRGFFKKLYK